MNQRILRLIYGYEFEHQLYKAARKNLADLGNPLRFNNFANAMKELARHILNRLAPDHEVMACCWFNDATSITRRLCHSDRAKYAIQGGLSDAYVEKTLGIDIMRTNNRLSAAFRELGRFTCVDEQTFGLSESEVAILVVEMEDAFHALFGTIRCCRDDVAYQLHVAIDNTAMSWLLTRKIHALDGFAIRHSVEEIDVRSTSVTVSHSTVDFMVEGSIEVELHYGSNTNRDDSSNSSIDASFPFNCRVICPAVEPNEKSLELVFNSLEVDRLTWFD